MKFGKVIRKAVLACPYSISYRSYILDKNGKTTGWIISLLNH